MNRTGSAGQASQAGAAVALLCSQQHWLHGGGGGPPPLPGRPLSACRKDAPPATHQSHSGVCESTSLEKKSGLLSTCAAAQRLRAGGHA